jgi:hypothetical protein
MGRKICLFVYYAKLQINVELEMVVEGAALKGDFEHWV